MPIERTDITGVILAGGLSRRLHGTPKALIELGGVPLIRQVFDTFKPQVGTVVINANDRLERFQEFQVPVLRDAFPGYRGPLAGIATVMAVATTPYLAVVPCDSPFLAHDLVSRLSEALVNQGGRIAVASVAGRWQPVFAVLSCELRPALERHLTAGGSKIDSWYATHDPCVVDFSDEIDSFLNINTMDDLDHAARQLADRTQP